MSPRSLLLPLFLVAACQPDDSGLDPPAIPAAHISDGRSGGNPDLFFGPPLAEAPRPGDPNFEPGADNRELVPHVRICISDGAPSAAGCRTDVTQPVTGRGAGLAMELNRDAEMYGAVIPARSLDRERSYRIEIWGLALETAQERGAVDARWLFGWRDIRHGTTETPCSFRDAFCRINFNQPIPVTVRVEQAVFCPEARNCAVQFVRNGRDANLQARLGEESAAPSAQLFIPGQSSTDFALALEPCSGAENTAVSTLIDIPTYGPCLKTITKFSGELATPAIVSLCTRLDASGFGLTQRQQQQLTMHHVSADLARVQALPEAHRCASPTSGAPAGANVTLIDRGGGGHSPFIGSFFKLALPAKFEYVTLSHSLQFGVAGATFELAVRVIDFFDQPVRNARVRWRAALPPEHGAAVQGSVIDPITLTDAIGIARSRVRLAPSAGRNVFFASGRGIADERRSGCIIPPATPAGCDGPRSQFDPFLPLHVPEFDASGVERPVELVLGTRQPFTVDGR